MPESERGVRHRLLLGQSDVGSFTSGPSRWKDARRAILPERFRAGLLDRHSLRATDCRAGRLLTAVPSTFGRDAAVSLVLHALQRTIIAVPMRKPLRRREAFRSNSPFEELSQDLSASRDDSRLYGSREHPTRSSAVPMHGQMVMLWKAAVANAGVAMGQRDRDFHSQIGHKGRIKLPSHYRSLKRRRRPGRSATTSTGNA